MELDDWDDELLDWDEELEELLDELEDGGDVLLEELAGGKEEELLLE